MRFGVGGGGGVATDATFSNCFIAVTYQLPPTTSAFLHTYQLPVTAVAVTPTAAANDLSNP
jgi:hypothetical protein